ncbi:SRPBCC family protein [Prauserella endophytica]|uniref:SRPBCC family protein n=1 Tax=Prauserella endophytica TaxID=1592324 RepID=A0ABY2S5F5_9PSEU|nr:SRPBCC family protein [Prauserella endophytica]TKG70787.1 SRPBCC family protein [Prauserella endophytica]
MHTISFRAETATVSISAPTKTVLDLVADPQQLPRWAPGVAKAVRPEGDEWVLVNGDTEFRITVRVSREHGTVDLLSAQDPRQGVFTRVLPNGEGSEYQFTMLFPADAPDTAVAEQMSTVREELRTVRKLCEEQAALG